MATTGGDPQGEATKAIKSSYVYFIGEGELDEGPVKIGWAVEPLKRLQLLQTGNPRRLTVHALARGGIHEERGLHHHFAASRQRGEWFGITTELLMLLEMLGANVKVTDAKDQRYFPSPRPRLRQLFAGLITGAVPVEMLGPEAARRLMQQL